MLTGRSEELPTYLQSTEAMYLYIHTDLSDSRKGFRFRYSVGCDLSLEAANGTLVSPGYDMEAVDFRYPNNLECDYRLRAPGGLPLSLRFVEFQVDDSDNVQLYDGSSSNGIQLHPAGGFRGKTEPKMATFSSHSGDLLIRFKCEALRNDRVDIGKMPTSWGTRYLSAQLLTAQLYQKLHTPTPQTLTAVE